MKEQRNILTSTPPLSPPRPHGHTPRHLFHLYARWVSTPLTRRASVQWASRALPALAGRQKAAAAGAFADSMCTFRVFCWRFDLI